MPGLEKHKLLERLEGAGEQDGRALGYASEELRGDKDVVIALAVSQILSRVDCGLWAVGASEPVPAGRACARAHYRCLQLGV